MQAPYFTTDIHIGFHLCENYPLFFLSMYLLGCIHIQEVIGQVLYLVLTLFIVMVSDFFLVFKHTFLSYFLTFTCLFLGLNIGSQIQGSSVTSANAGQQTTSLASSSMREENDTRKMCRYGWQRWGRRDEKTLRQSRMKLIFSNKWKRCLLGRGAFWFHIYDIDNHIY